MRHIEPAIEEIQYAFREVNRAQIICKNEVYEQVVPSISKIMERPKLKPILSYLKRCDTYTYRHNIGVAIVANIVGQALKMGDQERSELIIAAFLHDIGKACVPKQIVNKPSRLTQEEFAQVQKHTIYGYAYIEGMDEFSYRQALVALQHHEREDGRGYPYGLNDDEIDLFSKIVAVADVFHAMISHRVYRDPVPFLSVLQEMSVHAYGRLDSTITNCFVHQLMVMLLGEHVLLSNGEIGEIVHIHADDPVHPVVCIRGEMIDVSEQPSVYLKQFVKQE